MCLQSHGVHLHGIANNYRFRNQPQGGTNRPQVSSGDYIIAENAVTIPPLGGHLSRHTEDHAVHCAASLLQHPSVTLVANQSYLLHIGPVGRS